MRGRRESRDGGVTALHGRTCGGSGCSSRRARAARTAGPAAAGRRRCGAPSPARAQGARLVDLLRLAVDLVPALEAGGVKVGLHRLQLVAARLQHLLLAPAGGGGGARGGRASAWRAGDAGAPPRGGRQDRCLKGGAASTPATGTSGVPVGSRALQQAALLPPAPRWSTAAHRFWGSVRISVADRAAMAAPPPSASDRLPVSASCGGAVNQGVSAQARGGQARWDAAAAAAARRRRGAAPHLRNLRQSCHGPHCLPPALLLPGRKGRALGHGCTADSSHWRLGLCAGAGAGGLATQSLAVARVLLQLGRPNGRPPLPCPSRASTAGTSLAGGPRSTLCSINPFRAVSRAKERGHGGSWTAPRSPCPHFLKSTFYRPPSRAQSMQTSGWCAAAAASAALPDCGQTACALPQSGGQRKRGTA